jgi:Uma2 family endonuclease
LLVVEISDATLQQDRLSQAALYAAAGVPEYWIVNLRDHTVEAMRDPDRTNARYTVSRGCGRGEILELVGLPGAQVDVGDPLPGSRRKP